MLKATPLIAIVDDEESIRKALGRLIRAAGFSVETFSSGSDFLLSVRQHRPSCAVLDLRMPRLNGFQVLQALTRLGTLLPVVVITGDDSCETRARVLEHGARAYLRKPVDDALLLDAIRTAIQWGE